MATAQINRIVEQLRHAALSHDGAEVSDGQLLDAFIASRQESAFELLVRRHATMVLGVCLRVLGNHHDAEDAFQATFLVLVRKAASIKPRELVGNWLYGVAYQTAVRARASANKRRAREATMTPTPSIDANDLWHDLQPLLDQELTRLGDKYRVPIVLCDLEGKTRKEAAAQIGVPEGTLNSRLARGRTMLADRLTRRGVTLSAGALAAIFAQQSASASVSAALIAATVKIGAGAATAPVVVLADGVVQAMFLAKLGKCVAVSILATALVGVLGYAGYSQVVNEQTPTVHQAGEKPTDKKPAPPKERTKEEVAKLLEQFKANADEFEITIARNGLGLEKVDLRSVTLHSSQRKFAVPVAGPSGGPIFKSARITREQALKIIESMDSPYPSIFRNGHDANQPLDAEEPNIYFRIGYGSDANPGHSLHYADSWHWGSGGLTGSLGSCVDGEAAKILGALIKAINDDPYEIWKNVVKRERSQLSATWRLVGIEGGGEKLADRQIDDVIRKKMQWLAQNEGRKWQPGFLPPRMQLFLAFDADGAWKQYTEGDATFTFMNSEGVSYVEPAKKPKTIDLSVRQSNNKHKVENDREKKGTIKQGIYDTVDDTLRICWASPDKDRPTDFSTTKENGQTIWVMQRVRKAADESVLDTWTVSSVKGNIKKADWLADAETMRFTNAAKVRGVEMPSTVLVECKTGKVYVAEFALRETTKPKGINFIPLREGEGSILHGIYEVAGDDLKICVGPAGIDRPTAFEVNDGDQRALLVLQRPKPAQQEVRALLVNGRPVKSRSERATDYLKSALNVEAKSELKISTKAINVAEFVKLTANELKTWNAIFLCDVPGLSADEAERLEDYVRGGGGLVVFLGPNVDTKAYNGELGRLLPLKLLKVREATKDDAFHMSIQPGAEKGPPLAELNMSERLKAVKTYKFLEIEKPAADSKVRVLASFDEIRDKKIGPAGIAIMEHRPFAKGGRVVLVTTTADMEWTNWPASPCYLPVIHEVLRFVSGPQPIGAVDR